MNADSGIIQMLRSRGELWAASEQLSSRPLTAKCEALADLFPDGWPRGRLIEILSSGPGFGEVSLFMGLAAELTANGQEVAWLGPEGGIPNAPALAALGIHLERFLWIRTRNRKEAAWAAYELLASGVIPLVLLNQDPKDIRTLRGLAFAARKGCSLGVLFRENRWCDTPSPAHLRLTFLETARPRRLVVLKGRGIASETVITLRK